MCARAIVPVWWSKNSLWGQSSLLWSQEFNSGCQISQQAPYSPNHLDGPHKLLCYFEAGSVAQMALNLWWSFCHSLPRNWGNRPVPWGPVRKDTSLVFFLCVYVCGCRYVYFFFFSQSSNLIGHPVFSLSFRVFQLGPPFDDLLETFCHNGW